jgi:hypothetical protein
VLPRAERRARFDDLSNLSRLGRAALATVIAAAYQSLIAASIDAGESPDAGNEAVCWVAISYFRRI